MASVHSFDTESEAAAALAGTLVQAIARRPTLVLGLAAGRSPVPVYDELVRHAAEDGVDFSGVVTFNLDEFVGISPSHPGSFRRAMHEILFNRVNLLPGHIHFLDGLAPDPGVECARYEEAIRRAGGLDLQILGIGMNGHIGFNEPGDALQARTHRVRLHQTTRHQNAAAFGGDADLVPRDALSMGMGTILKARRICLIATGERKATVVERALHGAITTRLPASFLQLHSNVEVFLDRTAAAALPQR